MSCVVFLIYVGTLGLAFGSVATFMVIDPGTLFLIGAFLAAPTALVFAVYKRSEPVGIAAAHFLLALLFHPAVSFNAPEYSDREQQLGWFNLIHSQSRSVEQGSEGYWSYVLSRSLMDKERLSFRSNSPIKYWAYPPSVVLLLWGGIAFFYFPVASRKRSTHVDG